MHKTISTSIGDLTLVADDDGAITQVAFGGGAVDGETGRVVGEASRGGAASAVDSDAGASASAAALDAAATQLQEYLAGDRTAFDLPLRAQGNAFEQLVWDELVRIPYGETASYGEIARRIGHPGSARAVGRANARNPIAIVVPCHRVIGSDGSLTGYGGGLDLKRSLLALEAETARW
jgi:methylated-DNA-[protein]-cysteine S-methyltransferase